MVKMKTGQVLNAFNVLTGIQQSVGEEKLVGRGPYWVAVLLRKLEPYAKAAEEQRSGLIKKYGVEQMRTEGEGDEAKEVPTGNWSVDPSKMAEFAPEWLKVAGEDLELDIKPVRDDAFDPIPFSVNDKLVLGDLIAEPA
jgi:hypothetical protein